MTARDFCYWLQGYFEVDAYGDAETVGLTGRQAEVVRKHLDLVFAHDIDPKAGPPAHQATLNAIHGQGGSKPRC